MKCKKFKLKLGTLATFSGVILLNVDVGLYIGIVASLLLVIFKSQRLVTLLYSNRSKK